MNELDEYILELERYRNSQQILSYLHNNQVPLGKEFSDVLFNNIWDLYETDETDEGENQLDMWDEFGTGL